MDVVIATIARISVRFVGAINRYGLLHVAEQLLEVDDTAVVLVIAIETIGAADGLEEVVIVEFVASFERAVDLYSKLIYDEPEPLPFAAQHWLGAALLEAKRYSDAERVYREELKKHPNNGWSLFGLKAAPIGQGKPSDDVAKQFDAAWARSDAWIQASRY